MTDDLDLRASAAQKALRAECNASEDALRRMLALAAGTLTDAVDALADYRAGMAPMDDVLRSISARARDIATFLD